MIVVQLTGGMGNQMFQYATARALAARRGTELILDSSWIDGSGGSVSGEVRRFELGHFTLSGQLRPVEQVARLPGSGFGRLRRRRRPAIRVLDEPPFGAPIPDVVDAHDDTYLRGFWQNVSYFADAEPLLRTDFTFRPAIVQKAASTIVETDASRAVSVHVRRSDYATDPGVRDRMGTLETDYYRRAVETIASRAGDLRLFVFTDDYDWCTSELKLGFDTTVIAATRAEGDAWASIMYLMTRCNHHVLANSSFSWWGAWLNAKPGKIVIAPRPWLLDARWDDEHRVPHEWIRIDRDGHQADQPPSTTTFAPVT